MGRLPGHFDVETRPAVAAAAALAAGRFAIAIRIAGLGRPGGPVRALRILAQVADHFTQAVDFVLLHAELPLANAGIRIATARGGCQQDQAQEDELPGFHEIASLRFDSQKPSQARPSLATPAKIRQSHDETRRSEKTICQSLTHLPESHCRSAISAKPQAVSRPPGNHIDGRCTNH